jgi:hypothetical protein
MAEELPSIVSTFKVVGRLVKGVADSNDIGLQPDISTATMTVWYGEGLPTLRPRLDTRSRYKASLKTKTERRG